MYCNYTISFYISKRVLVRRSHYNFVCIQFLISFLEYFISYQKRIQYAIEVVRLLEKFVARKPEKEVISMRIPLETLKKVDSRAASVGISRNELINQMIQYALSNMEDITEEET